MRLSLQALNVNNLSKQGIRFEGGLQNLFVREKAV